jgi:hypothetical protein
MAKRRGPYLAEVSTDLREWHLIAEYDDRSDAVQAAFDASIQMGEELRRHVWYRSRLSPAVYGRPPPELPPPPPQPAQEPEREQEVGNGVRPLGVLGRVDWRAWEPLEDLRSAKRKRRRHTSAFEARSGSWDDVVRAAEEDR